MFHCFCVNTIERRLITTWSLLTQMLSFLHSWDVPAPHRAALPPGPGQDRSMGIGLVFCQAVPLPARGVGARQPLPQLHPREERLAPAGPRRPPRRLPRGRPGGAPTEAEGWAHVGRPQRLPTQRHPEVPVPLRWRHEAAGSAGQREAGPGRRSRHRGVWRLQNLQAHRQRHARHLCQGFCLQVSGESTPRLP